MKTAERENPNRRPQCVANRADGAAIQYRSCSIMWAAKQENFQPSEKCFFLTSPFIDQTGQVRPSTHMDGNRVYQDLFQFWRSPPAYSSAMSCAAASVRRVGISTAIGEEPENQG